MIRVAIAHTTDASSNNRDACSALALNSVPPVMLESAMARPTVTAGRWRCQSSLDVTSATSKTIVPGTSPGGMKENANLPVCPGASCTYGRPPSRGSSRTGPAVLRHPAA